MAPASATDSMTYCTEDQEDEIKGTGVHALQHYEHGRTGTIKEIGRRTKRRGEWEEKIGTNAPRQTNVASPNMPWSQQKPTATTSTMDPEGDRTPHELLKPGTTAALMDPQRFQEKILAMSQPTDNPTGNPQT